MLQMQPTNTVVGGDCASNHTMVLNGQAIVYGQARQGTGQDDVAIAPEHKRPRHIPHISYCTHE